MKLRRFIGVVHLPLLSAFAEFSGEEMAMSAYVVPEGDAFSHKSFRAAS
jgi:hypothetical protein